MAEVRLEQVNKIYHSAVHALRDFNLTVADGERIVLVGPSGCGKTTTLRLIAGLESVSSGHIHIAGRPVDDLPPADRHVAMVFQSPTLYPHLSVRQNLSFGLSSRDVRSSAIHSRINEAVQLLELEPLLGRYPDQLSGGQQQRVALARAMVRRPNVFLLDEPLSDLDLGSRHRLRGAIINLHQHLQTTVIYVTHDQAEAMAIGQRIAVLRSGILQQVDTPENVFRQPTNQFVARFLGSPEMNFLSGEISHKRVFWQGLVLPITTSISNRPITIGVRPEDITIQASDSPTESWTGRVGRVEFLGHEAILHVEVAGQPVVIRSAPGQAIQRGQIVRLAFRPNQLHLFAVDGERTRVN